MVGRDRFLNDKDHENFFDPKNQFSISNDNYLNRFLRYLIEAAENDRRKWMLINEARNSEKTKTQSLFLRNVFGYYVTQTKTMLAC